MALVTCSECEKQISDKASACPGCGCPLSKVDKIDKVEINELETKLNKAIYLQFIDDGKDLQKSIDIYEYIIDKDKCSDEAYYAISNLQLSYDNVRTPNYLKIKINEILDKNSVMIKYISHFRNKDNNYKFCEKCNSKNKLIRVSRSLFLCVNCKNSYELLSKNNVNAPSNAPNNATKNAYEIPLGLYIATSIIGFPIGTGFATGFYFKQKNLLEKGEYEKLKDSIAGAKVICIGYSVAILAICIVFFTRLKYLFY